MGDVFQFVSGAAPRGPGLLLRRKPGNMFFEIIRQLEEYTANENRHPRRPFPVETMRSKQRER